MVFLTNHVGLWVGLFLGGLTLATMAGANPLTMSNVMCNATVSGRPVRKIFVATCLIVAITGEYALFVSGVFKFVSLIT